MTDQMAEKQGEKSLPPPLPHLPAELSKEQRESCIALAFLALKLTLEAKKNLTPEQRCMLCTAVDTAAGAGCVGFPLAVACWLRDKKELGNRLISTAVLACCISSPITRPFVRQVADHVLKLPTDLMEFLAELDMVAAANGIKDVQKLSCVKKISRDVLESLPPHQAAKYNSASKVKRTKKLLKKATAALEALGKPTEKSDADGVHVLHPTKFKAGAKNEADAKQLEKRVAELSQKATKMQAGDMARLIRHTHAAKSHEVMMSLLNKRYPENEEDFAMSGLAGEYDPERSGQRMRLEVPPTWDRELSLKGNVPTTWAALLRAKDDRNHYTLPYMALLRNLRNILLMGFSPAFLRTHVFSRLPQRNQIQGSGQTPISLSHTLAMLEKEFTGDKIKEMASQSRAGLVDIIAYHALLRKIRGPILGTSDKQVGIIGEFLGAPVWEPCGLKKQNGCFLALNRLILRDGKMLEERPRGKGKGKGKEKGKGKGKEAGTQEKWLPVALHPVSAAVMADLKTAFEEAIQVAAACATAPMSFQGTGPVILWMDLSNPPLQSAESASVETVVSGATSKNVDAAAVNKTDDKEKGTGKGKDDYSGSDDEGPAPAANLDMKAALKLGEGIVTNAGQEVELDEISTHRKLNLELRYFCPSYLDYNVMAYDNAGAHLWNATYSCVEIKNSKQENCVVHCRDVGGNPSPTEPAMRTTHIDLDSLDDKVFAMMVTSQLYSGMRPAGVSVALRECHCGGAAMLQGNHQPHDCKGKLLLCQDISAPLKKGGTTVYSCIYRDASDPQSWNFRNTLDLSLESESRVASQITSATATIFRQMFQEAALKSTMDANAVGYVRLCQLYQAVRDSESRNRKQGGAGPTEVRIFLSGIRKRCSEPEVQELQLTGKYVSDLEVVKTAKKQFCGKAVDTNISLARVLDAAGCGPSCSRAPAAVLRVANNSYLPLEELQKARERVATSFPYATIDARGHILEAYASLPPVKEAVFVPGQIESCVTLLRNLLAQKEQGDSCELLVRYVDRFLPQDTTTANIGQPSTGTAGSTEVGS